MRKLLERYLEAQKLLTETKAAFAAQGKGDPKSEDMTVRVALGAIEIANRDFESCKQQLEAAVQQAGLPSFEVAPTGPQAPMIMSNDRLLDEWVQREADKLQREVFFKYRDGREIRKRAQPRDPPATFGDFEPSSPRRI